jgi:hypothetical protein
MKQVMHDRKKGFVTTPTRKGPGRPSARVPACAAANHSRSGAPSATATPAPADGSICSFMRDHTSAVALKMSASGTVRIRSTLTDSIHGTTDVNIFRSGARCSCTSQKFQVMYFNWAYDDSGSS